MYKHNISFAITCLFLFCSPFLSGCNQPISKTTSGIENEVLSSTNYEEKWTIVTEPPNCRVYVQDNFIGVSPVEITCDGGKAELKRTGTYNSTYTGYLHWWDGLPRDGQTVRTPTNWTSVGWCTATGGLWNVKIFKEGYEQYTAEIYNGDNVFNKTFQKIGDNNIPERVVGYRRLLCVLRPISQVGQTKQVYRNEYQNQDKQRRKNYEAAKAEYEQALAAYNEALKKLNDAKLQASATSASNALSALHPGLKLLGSLGAQQAVQDAEKELEIARQRLERAKAKMNHLEW